MGLSIHTKLIIGASAKQIFGEFETTTQKIPLYSPTTGKPSGQFADLISQYLVGPNRVKYLVGTNQWDELSSECQYRFQNVALHAKLSDKWVHVPYADADELDHIILGLSIGKLSMDPYINYADTAIGRTMTEVSDTLRRAYGYKNGVQIYAMAYYSY